MSSTQIRPAGKDDMVAVHALIVELANYEKEPDAVSNTVEGLIRDGYGDQPLFNCLVAESDGIITGFALYYMSYSTWKGPCLYLEDLLVTESRRRDGIGAQLFEAVFEKAKEIGAKRFEWQVLNWNEPAIAFYKKYHTTFDADWLNCKIFL